MKKLLVALMAVAGFCSMAATASSDAGKRLVILHTNDTHSQIDPVDGSNTGGIFRRKVLIDSVRAAEPNVLLVDAGDAVQGTLFFNLYGGAVENRLMDSLRYDFRILGNHEFDNGTDSLIATIRNTEAQWLASNYKLRNSVLDSKIAPYAVRDIDGRRIGFLALNINPKGIISDGNYDGVEFLDPYKAADATAWILRNREGADLIVAITHIGYEPNATGLSDVDLARRSENIDIIIGGHSHTVVDPADTSGKKPSIVQNAVGKPVVVAQTGKSGRNLGYIEVDLDDLTVQSRLIPVDARLDSRIDKELRAEFQPYYQGVDSLMNIPLAKTSRALEQADPALLNFVADFIKRRGEDMAGPLDMAIINRGGLRRGLPQGTVTLGMVMQMMPFNNLVTVLEIKGSDLRDNFDVMAAWGGNGVSKGVYATYDPQTNKAVDIKINGKPLDPNAVYRVATIDYLANGGDYMEPLTRAKQTHISPNTVYNDFIDFLRKNYSRKSINPASEARMQPVKKH